MIEYEIVNDELYEVHAHKWHVVDMSDRGMIPIGNITVNHECKICGKEEGFKGFFDGRSISWED